MKKLFLAIIALAAVSLTADAQSAASYQGISTPTVAAATTATVSTNNVIGTIKQQNLALAFTFKLSASGTSNVVYTFARSIDGANYDTITKYTITIPATGTSTNTFSTNLNVGGFTYLRLDSIDNFNATGVLTNIATGYAIKTQAP